MSLASVLLSSPLPGTAILAAVAATTSMITPKPAREQQARYLPGRQASLAKLDQLAGWLAGQQKSGPGLAQAANFKIAIARWVRVSERVQILH